MNIFVGNLNSMTTARQLSALFFQFGRVISSRIVKDPGTGYSQRWGLIEMDNIAGALAIRRLDNMRFMNCYIEVIEAGM